MCRRTVKNNRRGCYCVERGVCWLFLPAKLDAFCATAEANSRQNLSCWLCCFAQAINDSWTWITEKQHELQDWEGASIYRQKADMDSQINHTLRTDSGNQLHIHSWHQKTRQKCHTFKPSVFPFKFCLIYMWLNSVSRRWKALLSDTDSYVANGNTDLEVCCKTCTRRHSFRSLSLSFVLFFLGSLL